MNISISKLGEKKNTWIASSLFEMQSTQQHIVSTDLLEQYCTLASCPELCEADLSSLLIRIKRKSQKSPNKHSSWRSKARLSNVHELDLSGRSLTKTDKRPVRLVYFLNCLLSDRYLEIFSAHLALLASIRTDYDQHFSLLVVLVGTITHASDAAQCVKILLPGLFINTDSSTRKDASRASRFDMHIVSDSLYEFAGISMLWSEALRANDRNTILLYAHCKGVSHIDNTGKRNTEEIAASKAMLGSLYSNIEIMNTFPLVNRLGCAAGGGGWFWFNFWMASASYICRLETPLETTRRHYYEDWLARDTGLKLCNTLRDETTQVGRDRPIEQYNLDISTCYSLFTLAGRFNLGEAYTPAQAIEMACRFAARYC